MEQAPKTSFIPKQGGGYAPQRQNRTFNVLTFFATIIFLASLALAIGVFFYERYTNQQLEGKKAEVASLRKSFSEGDIESIKGLEKRLNAVQALLNQHIAPSKVFDALEAKTETNAQISSFKYDRLPSGKVQVKLEGKAATFNTVALQEQELTNEKTFEQGSVVFSDLNVAAADKGKVGVTFTVSGNLDKAAVAYSADASTTPQALLPTADSTRPSTTGATATSTP